MSSEVKCKEKNRGKERYRKMEKERYTSKKRK